MQKQYDDYDDNSSQSKYAQTYTQYVGRFDRHYGMKSLGINPANGRSLPASRRYDHYDWNAADQVEIGNRAVGAGFLRSERR